MKQGYLWAYHSPPLNLILYDFQPGRSKTGPMGMLKDFNGYLQTDGYTVYEHDAIGGRAGVTLMHCMAHADILKKRWTQIKNVPAIF
ncbi:MAG TPA: transposase [Flavitalea sp.]|nr:transposase [Flavitalea sp.]